MVVETENYNSILSKTSFLKSKPKMAEKSKIVIIGGTGYIGKFIVEAAAKSGHPTFALVRDSSPSDPAKAQLIQGFKDSGVTLLSVCTHLHTASACTNKM